MDTFAKSFFETIGNNKITIIESSTSSKQLNLQDIAKRLIKQANVILISNPEVIIKIINRTN